LLRYRHFKKKIKNIKIIRENGAVNKRKSTNEKSKCVEIIIFGIEDIGSTIPEQTVDICSPTIKKGNAFSIFKILQVVIVNGTIIKIAPTFAMIILIPYVKKINIKNILEGDPFEILIIFNAINSKTPDSIKISTNSIKPTIKVKILRFDPTNSVKSIVIDEGILECQKRTIKTIKKAPIKEINALFFSNIIKKITQKKTTIIANSM